jgi:predicted AAA+ superfamily ATPase
MSIVSVESSIEEVRTVLQALHGLTILRGVLQDDAAQTMLHFLTALSASEPDPEQVARLYSQTFVALAEAVNRDEVLSLEDAWQAYLVARLLDADNLWTSLIERSSGSHLSSTLRAQAQRDLRTLQRLFWLSADSLLQLTLDIVTPSFPVLQDAWLPWSFLSVMPADASSHARSVLARTIAQVEDWTQLIAPLEHYWSRHGTGELARYSVFLWQGAEGLRGISHPDPIQLAGLIGYEHEHRLLLANTRRFLVGLPAQDVLLYGAPGTGKSSTVKALVNAYAEQGLRLVEVHKEAIKDLPRIVALLRDRAPHFLLFIDDLSFEEHETDYKMLKMLLEGTAEARPSNVLIYATTNRMNLIRENFSDRGKPTEDTNWRDTMDEKQSLVHRFGLRLTFVSPDQQRYLEIALGLAHQRNIALPDEIVRQRALLWERQHVGRSGRLARQFVDDLEAELKMAASS